MVGDTLPTRRSFYPWLTSLPRNDYVYMVPPFLAYYGVTASNRSLVAEAYNQCRLYRRYLRDDSRGATRNLWRHVLLGNWQDTGFWSTGNGWAAAGMLRVLGTMQNSQYARWFQREIGDLGAWVNEIHDAMYPFVASSPVCEPLSACDAHVCGLSAPGWSFQQLRERR